MATAAGAVGAGAGSAYAVSGGSGTMHRAVQVRHACADPRSDGEHGYITTGGNHGYGGVDSMVTELRVSMRWKLW